MNEDLKQAKAKLQMWLDAEDTVAMGQSYEINGRKLARADLSEIGKRISFWQHKVKRLSRGGLSIKYTSLM